MATSKPLFASLTYKKLEADLKQKCIEKDNYIKELEEILKAHGIEIPEREHAVVESPISTLVFKEGKIEEIKNLVEIQKKLIRDLDIRIEFHDLTFSTMVEKESTIQTVGSLLMSLLFFWNCPQKKRVDIISNLSGRILPRKMTLLIGPPGSGKSGLT